MALGAGEFLTVVPVAFIIPAHWLATGGWNPALPEWAGEEQDSDDMPLADPFQRAGSPSTRGL